MTLANPIICTRCKEPIEYGTMLGDGDGRGQKFAHIECVRLDEELVTEKVNHPTHYNSHPTGIECIDVVEAFDFNLGNVIKYVWRAGLKEDTTGTEDLEKAKWYLERAIERANHDH